MTVEIIKIYRKYQTLGQNNVYFWFDVIIFRAIGTLFRVYSPGNERLADEKIARPKC